MPATSRSGERLRRRSGSERAGSPSKSRTIQSSPRPQHLAEVVVAVVADHAADGPDVREQPQPVAHLLAAAAIGGERLDVGQVEEDLLDLLVDRRRQERERLGARLLGREVADRRSRGRAPCAGPSPRRGGARAQEATPARTRASSSASSQPSARRGTNRWRIPRVASSGRPVARIQPASAATLREAPLVRKRSSSSSGLTPASSRR